MKKYIFMTGNIHNVGGMAAYVSAKAEYLEREGWAVFCLFIGDNSEKCVIKSLSKYVAGGFFFFATPPWQMTRLRRNRYLRRVIRYLGKPSTGDEVIVESHDDRFAPWGEMIARRLNAKHITVPLNERYVGPDKHYRDVLDFYLFKLNRKELPFSPKRAELLFGDASLVKIYDTRRFIIDEDPVRDVPSPTIDSITHNDWNIGYVGRAAKGYLPNIIDGVCDFSKNHLDHNIQFVVIGDFSCRKEYFNEKSKGITNLSLIELGDQFPLPGSYYKKIDVVIAGSGSARCSIKEGVPVLVADAHNFLCNGRLGFDTMQSVYNTDDHVQMTYAEGLERILVQNAYDGMDNKYPPSPTVADCVKQNFEFIATSAQTKEYYDEKKFLTVTGSWLARLKSDLKYICRWLIRK